MTPRSAHAQHPGASSAFLLVAIVVFVLSLASIGGAYAWKQILLGSQAQYSSDLAAREKSLNIDQISLMKAQAAKIALARQLLNNHLAVSKIFDVAAQLAAQNVRFMSMDLTVPSGAQSPFQLSISGYGKDFPTVAFQSDVLNSLDKYGLSAMVKNAIVSNPTLSHDGTVGFGFTAQIDPSSFLYTKNLPAAPAASSPSSSQPTTLTVPAAAATSTSH